MIALSYSIALLITAIYALSHGGREGRAIVAIIGFLFAVSFVLQHASDDPEFTMAASLGVDLVSLAMKIGLALSSRRRWPIIIAAFQVNSVGAQIAILLSPAFKLNFHILASTIWAIPTLAVIVTGIFLDRRYDRAMTVEGMRRGKLESAT
ncbi:hypothetical protein DM806_01345 [Sphingobium lactosutens]|uniref:hypothetical protein n=1 Tax=Sphingobium lactosutens TaxID=522773 RepID=UPI0015BCEB18|nr:hypothetical protein [Sphingobium lactosutens]NWK94350.1 hypothetical protein [Sphingobium lactosutens]